MAREMTRDEVLAEMRASFELMTDKQKNEVLFNEQGQDWTPTLLLAEVQNETEYGKLYVQAWSRNKEKILMEDLLFALLTGQGLDGQPLMTCGDPNCPNCKGEVRPFDELPGLPPTGSDDPNAN
jgi:hypothetical protein